MEKCKGCGKEVTEGVQICEACLAKLLALVGKEEKKTLFSKASDLVELGWKKAKEHPGAAAGIVLTKFIGNDWLDIASVVAGISLDDVIKDAIDNFVEKRKEKEESKKEPKKE